MRTYVGLVALVALIVGFIAMNQSVSAPTNSGISCGTAMAENYSAARQKDQLNELTATMSRYQSLSDYEGECRSAISGRRMWSIPLTVVGLVVVIGAVVAGRRKPDAAAPPAPATPAAPSE